MAVPDIRREFVSLLPRLRRFALVLTGSVDQADDLVQGTLLRALDRIDQCRDCGHLDRWLFSIQKTVWLNTLRAATLRRTEPLEDYDGWRPAMAFARWKRASPCPKCGRPSRG